MEGYLPATAEPSVLAKFYGEPDTPLISIICMGSKDEFSRRAEPKDMKRFADSWAHFQGAPKKVEGTSLSELPGVDERRAAAFAFHGVQTVEQLAGLHDGAVGGMGVGAMELRRVAKMYVENKFTGQRSEDSARVTELEAQVAQLMDSNKQLLERLDALPVLTAPKADKPGIKVCAKPGCKNRVKVIGGRCRWHLTNKELVPVQAFIIGTTPVEKILGTDIIDSDAKETEGPETPEGYKPAPEKAFEYQK